MSNGLSYVISRTGLWIDIWAIIAIIGFVAIIIYFIVRRRNMVKMEEELEDLLADKYEREAKDLEESKGSENGDSDEELSKSESTKQEDA